MEIVAIGFWVVGFWIVCGVLSAIIASNRRRSGCAHFFLGFVFGPLWLIVMLAMGPGGAICPSCRESVDPAATVCPHCQRDIKPEAPEKLVACEKCGAVMAARYFDVCPSCGTARRPPGPEAT